jgi:hypothetical protein
MAKINETLSDEAHTALRKYQFGRSKANQGDALNSLLPEYWELLEIVSDLAKSSSQYDEGCILCRMRGFKETDHDETCPWIRARKIIGDLK